jgi:dihydrolipoamide dehydrogenase
MYDLVIIGSGPGGYVGAIRASQLGMNCAIVEKAELGGVCLNWGCIPTKALLKSAQAFNYAVHGNEYGFETAGEVKPDLKAIVARSRSVAEGMSRGVEFLLRKNKVTVICGSGRVTGVGKVEVSDVNGEKSYIEAKNIIIATGSRPNTLPFAPIDGNKIISYRQALIPEVLPKSLAVIGSGAIGSEFAFFYRSLGVDVYLIEYLSSIVPLEDDDVSAQLGRSFRKMGMKIYTSANVKSIDTSGDICKIALETKKGEEIVEAEKVLSAVGVIANIENLGLEELGVEIDRRKIKVNEFYMTNVPGIYAIGDVIPTPALAHVASAEAICCVESIAGLNPVPLNYENYPGCTYTSPEIASVGLTERAVKEMGLNYRTGKFPFTASGKASAAGERDGFVKLIIDSESDQILGAHLVGANVTEMISGLVVARGVGAKAKDIIHSIHPHPTMSEAIMEAAAAAHSEAIHI